ncbi:hypothetical protein BKH43_00905 [Helicobacter sp. 13S00401-1]|uniref:flagellar hook assembly protein FlgD n=1 Tax=Helicobacter sp. 13S00401-1 TaxID=1905758 RepID=UPI000BA69B9C|nr:flagellar hook assembly protein FlgD [Helicobacter sp. 13S00401-1]PAF51823.1 hypothetical protein BKH43_00905 [Helicobacter sp. 13S00401-1]
MAIDLNKVTGFEAAQAEKKKESSHKLTNGMDTDAFMKLFLEQLKNQDPTAPMETDKIISQTAQLTQVEMQEENKKAMKEVASAMKSTQETNASLRDFQGQMKKSLEDLDKGMKESVASMAQAAQSNSLNTVSMIGKIAETDVMGVDFKGDKVNFSLYFDDKIDASKGKASIEILDKNNDIVKTIPLDSKNNQKGYIDFTWDGKDDNGKQVPKGNYKIVAKYNLDEHTNKYNETRFGRGEIQSIIFDKGTPLMRLGELVLPLKSAIEFYPHHAINQNKSLEDLKQEVSSIDKSLDTKPLESMDSNPKMESKTDSKDIPLPSANLAASLPKTSHEEAKISNPLDTSTKPQTTKSPRDLAQEEGIRKIEELNKKQAQEAKKHSASNTQVASTQNSDSETSKDPLSSIKNPLNISPLSSSLQSQAKI